MAQQLPSPPQRQPASEAMAVSSQFTLPSPTPTNLQPPNYLPGSSSRSRHRHHHHHHHHHYHQYRARRPSQKSALLFATACQYPFRPFVKSGGSKPTAPFLTVHYPISAVERQHCLFTVRILPVSKNLLAFASASDRPWSIGHKRNSSCVFGESQLDRIFVVRGGGGGACCLVIGNANSGMAMLNTWEQTADQIASPLPFPLPLNPE